MQRLRSFALILEIILMIRHARAAAVLGQRLSFVKQSTCTYDYEVAVHTARGTRTTASEGFHLHALVSRKMCSQYFYCFDALEETCLHIIEERKMRYVSVISFVSAVFIWLAAHIGGSVRDKLHNFTSLQKLLFVSQCPLLKEWDVLIWDERKREREENIGSLDVN